MKQNNFLFWQPQFDLIKTMSASLLGKYTLVFLNYIIWLFFFYISYLLVRHDANIFWQLFIATALAETIERYIKNKSFWRRPMFNRGDATPVGLVDKWYRTGSFPSGHTIKAVYFLLFALQYNVISPVVFYLVTIPLILFRVIAGFHYPIDIFGGLAIGLVLWLLVSGLQLPPSINVYIANIFNFIFLIK